MPETYSMEMILHKHIMNLNKNIKLINTLCCFGNITAIPIEYKNKKEATKNIEKINHLSTNK